MKSLDVPLIVVTIALCLIGGLVLDSATVHHLGMGPEAMRQGISMLVGLVLMVIISKFNPLTWGRCSKPLYVVGLLGLILVRVPGIGQVSHGARRWISMGPLGNFQPSEPAKLFLVLVLAWLLSRPAEKGMGLGRALGALLLAAIPSALILMQPDMGTTLVLLGTTVIMLVVAGASPVLLMGLGTAACLAAPHFMHDYQRDRLMTFLNPDADPMGLGYNLIQAQVAVGAGRMYGHGLFSGPMSQHGFVPENWTDFIFSVIGEELGFAGCVGFLALYAIMVACLVRTAIAARDRFDMLLGTGIAAMVALHVFINIGMVIGLLPATGLPLPFASYGGTAVITQMVGLGMVMGVYRRRRAQMEDVWGLQTAPEGLDPAPAVLRLSTQGLS